MTIHALVQAFEAAKPTFGAWITLPGMINARRVAESSPHLSWVMIDCAHRLTSLQPGAAESIQAITGLSSKASSALVCLPATGTSTGTSWQINYVFDAGARGILVPMVSDAAKARKVISDSCFPPNGRCGFGNPFTQSIWGISTAEYLKSANKHVTIMIQIETREGVKNIEEIAAVDGIDVLFIGPYDLSLTLGYPPPSPDSHPDVERIIQQVLKSMDDKGKKCGIYCNSRVQSFKHAQEGFDMINVPLDSGTISKFIARNLADAVGGQ